MLSLHAFCGPEQNRVADEMTSWTSESKARTLLVPLCPTCVLLLHNILSKMLILTPRKFLGTKVGVYVRVDSFLKELMEPLAVQELVSTITWTYHKLLQCVCF